MVKQWNQNKQDWPEWSPGQWPKRRPAAKAKGDNHHKGEAAVAIRPYDADGGSSTSAPSSSDGSQQAGMQEFFKEFMAMSKELGQPLPERLRKLVPNTDGEELKEQQKRLNRLRTLRNRIEGKEKAIKQDEIQWEKWLKDIKESIVSQRQKHEEAQTRLAEELTQLRKEEEDLKNNREEEKEDFEVDEEMDPEAMVDGLLAKEDQQKIREKHTKAEDALEVMQKNMEAQYQQRMMQERAQMSLEFQRMLQQALATQHAAQKPPEYVDLEVQDAAMGTGQKADAMGTATVEAQAAAVAERFSGMTKEETAKRALIPFGVARRDRMTRQPQSTSPYGRKAQEQDEEKDKEKNKEQTIQEMMKSAVEQTTEATQQGQVPDPSRAPDTGQSWAHTRLRRLDLISFGEVQELSGWRLLWACAWLCWGFWSGGFWCFHMAGFPLQKLVDFLASESARGDIECRGNPEVTASVGWDWRRCGSPFFFCSMIFIFVMLWRQICFTLRGLRRTTRSVPWTMSLPLCRSRVPSEDQVNFHENLHIYMRIWSSIISYNGSVWIRMSGEVVATNFDVQQNTFLKRLLLPAGMDGVNLHRRSTDIPRWQEKKDVVLDIQTRLTIPGRPAQIQLSAGVLRIKRRITRAYLVDQLQGQYAGELEYIFFKGRIWSEDSTTEITVSHCDTFTILSRREIVSSLDDLPLRTTGEDPSTCLDDEADGRGDDQSRSGVLEEPEEIESSHSLSDDSFSWQNFGLCTFMVGTPEGVRRYDALFRFDLPDETIFEMLSLFLRSDIDVEELLQSQGLAVDKQRIFIVIMEAPSGAKLSLQRRLRGYEAETFKILRFRGKVTFDTYSAHFIEEAPLEVHLGMSTWTTASYRNLHAGSLVTVMLPDPQGGAYSFLPSERAEPSGFSLLQLAARKMNTGTVVAQQASGNAEEATRDLCKAGTVHERRKNYTAEIFDRLPPPGNPKACEERLSLQPERSSAARAIDEAQSRPGSPELHEISDDEVEELRHAQHPKRCAEVLYPADLGATMALIAPWCQCPLQLHLPNDCTFSPISLQFVYRCVAGWRSRIKSVHIYTDGSKGFHDDRTYAGFAFTVFGFDPEEKPNHFFLG